MPETHTPWRVRGTFVECDEREICECSMAEDAALIAREHNTTLDKPRDSRTRFDQRLWSWACVFAVASAFLADANHQWAHWLLVPAVGLLLILVWKDFKHVSK